MNLQACHKRKHCTCGCCMPRQHFIAMAYDSKWHTIIFWCVISMKLNIGKKTGLEMKNLACFQLKELMFTG